MNGTSNDTPTTAQSEALQKEPEIVSDPILRSETVLSPTIHLPKRKEDPLVFNIPEVPNEVRGVFHKNTGSVNYTALVEFVKNMKSNSTGDLI